MERDINFTMEKYSPVADARTGVSIHTLAAVSLAAHLLFLTVAGTIAGMSGEGKKKTYISVDLIQKSKGSNQTQLAARPKSKKQLDPEPVKIERSESLPEAAMTLHPRVAAMNAPVPEETTEQLPGSGPDTGTNYQSMHRISRPPVFRKRITPEYPPAERNAARESRVVVEVYISIQGVVDDVKLLKSGGAAFDEAVMKAVKASSFEPGYMDGRQVAVRMQIPYVFRLR